MINMLEPILANVDTKVILIVAGILVISGILAIIKKVVKLGLVMLVVAILVSTLIPMAQSFQEKYSINVSNGVIALKVDGKEYNIDKENCKSITIENKGLSTYLVSAEFNAGRLAITMPGFMVNKIKDFGEKHKIPIKMLE